ncbi:MAG: phosphoribosylformylglycinamidine synthase subunit PurQ, partial [Alistipes sp.]|nr:phosphoribosylformylglycinamidine synthase subunit PurQ [Alistipes sp.]
YGNQIGLATTHVREIYHENYVAKRLEVGAVVGAVKAENVRRESPAPGDVVLLLGGRTGRDGIGGATGSSKQHTTASLEECGSEVQKGNAPEERKIQHLFRRGDVTKLIKKSNDFGAGGVSVAIGELTDGLDIYLDRVPVKYNGLNATELAISESQERMSVVIERKDMERMIELCREENIEVTYVADVTDTQRMRMFYKGEKVADLTREFIDSAGAKHYTKITLGAVEERNPFHREVEGATLREKMLNNLSDWNVVSQRGLCEMFDSTIGRSTVLMPFGGKTQRTETQVSMQTLPVRYGRTSTASVMAYGYNPYLSSWSPYHGAEYAVVEACAKVVASGASYENMRFSYQEYFERMTDARSWGKPMSALLGTIRMQKALELPSIGGKDSMSGTFQNINVPPTLIAFGITTLDARKAISPEFKEAGNGLYLVKHTPNKNYTPNVEELKRNFKRVTTEIERGNIVSAYAIGFGGVAEAVAKMSFGNEIGATLTCDEATLFDYSYGSILVEAKESFEGAIKVGATTAEKSVEVLGEKFSLAELYKANSERFEKVYPAKGKSGEKCRESNHIAEAPQYKGEKVDKVQVYFPVFPGTNCDYDTARAFEREGAETHIGVFRNLTPEDVLYSIDAMAAAIDKCHILVLSGGFSLGDEPDGSGKFIASVLNNVTITKAVHALLDRGGLILGICNGFQALVKSGLLPYGRLGMVTKESPTLFHNDIHRHIS